MNAKYNVKVEADRVVVTVPSTKAEVHLLDTRDVFYQVVHTFELLEIINKVTTVAKEEGVDHVHALGLLGAVAIKSSAHPEYGFTEDDDPYQAALVIIDAAAVRLLDLCDSAFERAAFYARQGVDLRAVVDNDLVFERVAHILVGAAGLQDYYEDRILDGDLVLS